LQMPYDHRTRMTRIETSVWNNGGTGWGLKILGGTTVRQHYFSRQRQTVILHIDQQSVSVNIAKKSFWTRTCGELIKREIGDYVRKPGLKTGDRVWLRVIRQGVEFALELN